MAERKSPRAVEAASGKRSGGGGTFPAKKSVIQTSRGRAIPKPASRSGGGGTFAAKATPAKPASNVDPSGSAGYRATKSAPVSSSGVNGGGTGGYNAGAAFDPGSLPVASGTDMSGYTSAADFTSMAEGLFGATNNVNYTPVDISKLFKAMGDFDPNSVNGVYDPMYQGLDTLRAAGQADYDTGSANIQSIYKNLVDQVTASRGGVADSYGAARDNINEDANMLRSNIAQDGADMQASRQSMLSNLGIQSAAPGLMATDAATLEGKSRVSQAAGIDTNLISTLGANADAYINDTANNSRIAGAGKEADFLGQFQDYNFDLNLKQTDIDSAKAQAMMSAQENYKAALRQTAAQATEFEFRNQENLTAAQQQQQANSTNMFQSYLNQYNTDRTFTAQANDQAMQGYSAQLKAAQDAQNAQQQQNNWQDEYNLKAQSASAGTVNKNPYENMGVFEEVAARANAYKLQPQQIDLVTKMLQAASSDDDGMGLNAADFAADVARENMGRGSQGITSKILADLAFAYFNRAGGKSATPQAPSTNLLG